MIYICKLHWKFTRLDGTLAELTTENLTDILDDELLKLKRNIESSTNSARLKQDSLNNLKQAGTVFKELVFADEMPSFVQDNAIGVLNDHVLKVNYL